jgi:hypothetical protein
VKIASIQSRSPPYHYEDWRRGICAPLFGFVERKGIFHFPSGGCFLRTHPYPGPGHPSSINRNMVKDQMATREGGSE